MRKGLIVVVLLALAVAAFAFLRGGGGGHVGADDPLAFVPADTPFVFANIEPLPGDVAARWMAQIDPQLAQWRRHIRLLLDTAEQARSAPAVETDSDSDAGTDEADEDGEDDVRKSGLPDEAIGWLRALDAELAQATDAASLQARFGLGSEAKAAIYGIGFVPVFRMTLADAPVFIAAVARIEKNSGHAFTPLTVDGVAAGWRIDVPDSPIQGVVAVIGDHLVVSVAPLSDPAATREVLGLDRPTKSLADTGALQTLNKAEGFSAYGSGYLDTERLLAQFRAPATALELAFLTPLDMEKPSLPAECAADVDLIARSVPRFVAGYTRIDTRKMDAVARIVTSAAIAEDLKTLRAPTPGLAASADSLVATSMAFKVSALPVLARKWADATQKAPWTCSALTGLNDAMVSLRESMNNPAIYAAGPMSNAFLLSLDRIEFDTTEMKLKDIAGHLVLGSENPAALLGGLSMVAPPVAALGLKPDEAPKPLVLDMLGEITDAPLFAAMGKQSLGIGIGTSAEKSLLAYLSADETEQPLLYMSYQGRFMSVIADAMREAAKLMPDAEGKEILAQAEMMEDAYVKHIERLSLSILLTDRGIEFRQHAAFVP